MRAAIQQEQEPHWRPVSQRPEIDQQPSRQFVLIDGESRHTGMRWSRKHWGIAYVRKPGSDDELQQYRRSDIEQILKDGDIDCGEVTHWMPATVPPFP